jgi:hypothetical protein
VQMPRTRSASIMIAQADRLGMIRKIPNVACTFEENPGSP